MTFSRFIFRKGVRIPVYSARSRESAARNMAASGFSAAAICGALGMRRATAAAICAAPKGSIWGRHAALLAAEMRRAA